MGKASDEWSACRYSRGCELRSTWKVKAENCIVVTGRGDQNLEMEDAYVNLRELVYKYREAYARKYLKASSSSTIHEEQASSSKQSNSPKADSSSTGTHENKKRLTLDDLLQQQIVDQIIKISNDSQASVRPRATTDTLSSPLKNMKMVSRDSTQALIRPGETTDTLSSPSKNMQMISRDEPQALVLPGEANDTLSSASETIKMLLKGGHKCISNLQEFNESFKAWLDKQNLTIKALTDSPSAMLQFMRLPEEDNTARDTQVQLEGVLPRILAQQLQALVSEFENLTKEFYSAHDDVEKILKKKRTTFKLGPIVRINKTTEVIEKFKESNPSLRVENEPRNKYFEDAYGAEELLYMHLAENEGDYFNKVAGTVLQALEEVKGNEFRTDETS